MIFDNHDQKISVLPGEVNKLYILAAATKDTQANLIVGNKTISIRKNDSSKKPTDGVHLNDET